MLLSGEKAKKSKLVQKIEEAGIKLDNFISEDTLPIALYLLESTNKESKSKWAYYIKTLPKNWDNYPLFYSEEEMQELTGS